LELSRLVVEELEYELLVFEELELKSRSKPKSQLIYILYF